MSYDERRIPLQFQIGAQGYNRGTAMRLPPGIITSVIEVAGKHLNRILDDEGIDAPNAVDRALNEAGLIVPPVTEAPGFDGRDFSNIGGGRV